MAKTAALALSGIEDRLDHQEVCATIEQRRGLLAIGRDQLVEGDVAVAGIVHIRTDAAGAVGGRQAAGHEARGSGLAAVASSRLLGPGRGGQVDLGNQMPGAVVGLGHGGAVEGVGGDDVRAGFRDTRVDAADDVRVGSAPGGRCCP
jgi:hypothetical protein